MSLRSVLSWMAENPTTAEGKKLKAATEKIVVLERELAAVKRQNEELTRRNESLNQQNKWLTRANEALEVEKGEAVTKVADSETLRREHEKVLAQFEMLKKYAASLRLRIKTQDENAVHMRRCISLMQEQLRTAKDEATTLRERLVSSLNNSEP